MPARAPPSCERVVALSRQSAFLAACEPRESAWIAIRFTCAKTKMLNLKVSSLGVPL